MTAWRGRKRLPMLVAALTAAIVAILGGLMTDLSPWYYALKKPDWSPPDWLFGPAWTIIFALIALAGVTAWKAAETRRQRRRIVAALAVNAILNNLWSAIFFRLERPQWALVEVVLLWFSIVALIVVLGRLSRTAGWLLIPYLIWVGFAGVLNLSIVRLNNS